MLFPQSQLMPDTETPHKGCHSCRVNKITCGAAPGVPCPNWKHKAFNDEIDQRHSKRRRINPKISNMSSPLPDGVWAFGSSMNNTYHADLSSHYIAYGDKYSVIAKSLDAEWTSLPLDSSCELPRIKRLDFCKACWRGANQFDRHIVPPPLTLDTQPIFDSTEDEFWNTFTDFSSEHSSQGSPSSLNSTLSLVSLVPDFANPLPTSMDSATIDSLHVNGVLSLPNERLQGALLQAFFECVQPIMPILEWQDFLNAIYGRSNGHGSVSLLLYHAVMFSATTFVDLEHLHAAGYTSRREAHEAFFQKAKLLYLANYEQDTLTIVQSMLLLTYRVDAKDGDDSSHWIGVAISMATSIGLLQDPAGTRNFNHSAKLWKRVAWACYTTDCLISLRLRCRPNIHGLGFSHEILTEDDFEFYSLPAEDQIMLPNCPIAYNITAQKELAHIFIANTRLCICISEVLDFRGKTNHIYASAGSPTQNNTDNTDQAARVSISEFKLAEWADSLPSSCHAPSPDSSNADDPTIAVQRSLLHLQFYTTIAILHQLQPFPSSKFCVQHAASQITLIASELLEKDLHHKLSITGVTAILVALIIHMSQLKASHSPERNKAIKDFQLCLDVMGSLREVYWEAESITEWASKAIM